ncbi:hypothetical protein [Cellulomonas bogoriensis]|uniref:Uncharacterized protein n=1 Tax=Cellulomonas bogoriensis 69B4 = DSM 16987 TaxID=1386082 RepID=A0A0A0BZT1_9CELL|nr:hypothetical protein [Cellulomonas bogoriensis]KGM13446.1 hypothetical protein N869_14135 [Cellulomonas bogoriensis 69B4 = DSM 16987]
MNEHPDDGTNTPDREQRDRIQAEGPDTVGPDAAAQDAQQMRSMPPEPHGTDDDPASHLQG